MLNKTLFVLLFSALLVSFAAACWWDGEECHGEANNNCYRALNQSSFIVQDPEIPETWDPEDCADPSGLPHRYWMEYIYNLTAAAGSPFGAVIVNISSGQVAAVGINTGISNRPFGHGEMNALINFTQLYPHLERPYYGFSLYTTGEPCPMCATALLYSGFREVIWATSITKLIRAGWDQVNIRMKDIYRAYARNPYHVCIIGGVLADKADSLTIPWPFTRYGAPAPTWPPATSCCSRNGGGGGGGGHGGGHGGGGGGGGGRGRD